MTIFIFLKSFFDFSIKTDLRKPNWGGGLLVCFLSEGPKKGRISQDKGENCCFIVGGALWQKL